MKIPVKPKIEIDHVKAGEAIRGQREKKKISLRRFANQLGISAPYLSDLERGRRNWKEDIFNKAQTLLK